MKCCGRCKKFKEEKEFIKNRCKKNGLSPYCKECKHIIDKEYYANNESRRIQVKRTRTNTGRELCTKFVIEYLLSHPCVDCRKKDIRVLDFDHIRDKDYNISTLINKGNIELLKKEIEKCEIRCSDCHRIRHAEKLNTWKNKMRL